MNRKEYNADSIVVLEGLEAVRRRPGMYIGSTGNRGLVHLVYEIIDNSIDEHVAGYCTEIIVTLEKDGHACIEDNGRGIPVGMHKKGISAERVILTTLHAGGKFDNDSYKVHGGLHGVGSSVVNALSEEMEIIVSDGKNQYRDYYKKGKPALDLVDGLLPKIGKTSKRGTKIRFLPDPEIFEKTRFKAEYIKNRIHELAFLNPNLTIHFIDEIQEERVDYHEPEGLVGYIKEMNKGKPVVTDPITIQGMCDNIEVNLVLQFTDSYEENILGFCNNISTIEGGTHLTGFKTKYTTLINGYARELGILKEKDMNFVGADTRCGMTAIISVKHPDPQFEGQTKTKLGSQDAVKAVSTVIGEELTIFFDKNVSILQKCIACAEKAAKVRKAEEKVRNNLLQKQTISLDGNGKLANCESKDYSKNEIFIVEGNSAGGSAKQARNRKYQAILPIRGKILNVEKASIDKILANQEIKTMILAFGCGFSEGYGDDFNIEKLKYNKIIIMTDADVDGSHIDTLLLTFFYRFMPDLIKEGHVYLATPPLYKVIPDNKKDIGEYLYDDKALEKYRKTHKNFKLSRFKGLGEMDSNQLWETTMNPETRILRQIHIEDMLEANQITDVLMGNDVEPRKNFIYSNAENAYLDI